MSDGNFSAMTLRSHYHQLEGHMLYWLTFAEISAKRVRSHQHHSSILFTEFLYTRVTV